VWDNFIGQQIRRCNRNLLIANIVLLGAVIAYASGFDYKEEGWTSLYVSVPLFLLAAWNFVKWKNRTQDFACHPICKHLSRFGTVEDVVQQIETTVRSCSVLHTAGAMAFGTWLFKKTAFGLRCFRIPDLVWLYKKVTKHSVNFIPTRTSFAALLCDRYGDSLELQAEEKQVEALMTTICQQSPWIVAGFSNDLEKLWKSQRASFVAVVDERRKEFSKAAAAGCGK
jgi:Family of unknown function (DUF6709)